jgi:Caspase domain
MKKYVQILLAVTIALLMVTWVAAQEQLPVFHLDHPAKDVDYVENKIGDYIVSGTVDCKLPISNMRVQVDGRDIPVELTGDEQRSDGGTRDAATKDIGFPDIDFPGIRVNVKGKGNRHVEFHVHVPLHRYGPYRIRLFASTEAVEASYSVEIIRKKQDGAEFYSNLWVLLIGIGNYKELPASSRLTAPANDVEAWRNVLTQDYGVSPNHILSVVDDQATRSNLNAIIDRLATPNVLGPDDALLMLFTGHGVEIGGQGYIVPVDATWHPSASMRANECISLSSIEDRFNQMGAKHILFLEDMCYGGIIGRDKQPLGPAPQESEPFIQTTDHWTRIAWAANANDKVAYEDKATQQSFFSEKVIEALREKPKHNGEIGGPVWTVGQMQERVARAVEEASHQGQHPQAYILKKATATGPAGDFVFAKVKAALRENLSSLLVARVSDLPEEYLRRIGHKNAPGSYLICHVDDPKLGLHALDFIEMQHDGGLGNTADDDNADCSVLVTVPFGKPQKSTVRVTPRATSASPFESITAVGGHLTTGFGGEFYAIVDSQRGSMAAAISGSKGKIFPQHVRTFFQDAPWDPSSGILGGTAAAPHASISGRVSSKWGVVHEKITVRGNIYPDGSGTGHFFSTWARGDWKMDALSTGTRFGVPLQVFRLSVVNGQVNK